MRKKIIIRKLLELVITLFFATLIIFTLTHMAPGDPVKLILGDPEVAMTNTEAYERRYEEMRKELHLDGNIIFQYATWVNRLLHFDLGTSLYTNRPVRVELGERLPATILLTIPSIIIQLILGVIFGTISALSRGKTKDNVIRIVCVIFSSIPVFAFGLLLLYYFGVHHNVYEITNVASLKRIWLPSLTLGFISAPSLVRVIRSNMLQEFGKIYISSALSRGLKRKLILKNAFKNVLLPVITIIVLSLTSLVGGAVVVENIFSWPGIGKYAMDSILLHDYPVIQGYGFTMVSIIILINFLVDIIYVYVDPRIRNKGGVLNEA